MAFNGTWKVDRNENYEKFLEEMGEWTDKFDKASPEHCWFQDQTLQYSF